MAHTTQLIDMNTSLLKYRLDLADDDDEGDEGEDSEEAGDSTSAPDGPGPRA